jgi:hypothetical protein
MGQLLMSNQFTLRNQNILTHSRFRLSQLEPHRQPIEMILLKPVYFLTSLDFPDL